METPGAPGIPGAPGKVGFGGIPGRPGYGGWSNSTIENISRCKNIKCERKKVSFTLLIFYISIQPLIKFKLSTNPFL